VIPQLLNDCGRSVSISEDFECRSSEVWSAKLSLVDLVAQTLLWLCLGLKLVSRLSLQFPVASSLASFR
jgi:hypothetical protein